MKQNLIYISFIIIIVFYSSCKNENPSSITTSTLIDSIERLHIQVDSISKTNLDGGGEMDYWKLSGDNYIALKQRGVSDPTIFVSDHLSNKPDLIPFDPTLGGRMAFTRITIVGNNWAMARFEDGHIGGEMLLSYQLVGDSIRWKILDAHLSD
jgi:hypothetical protein